MSARDPHMLSAALAYAGAGVSVFPVNSKKLPLTGEGGFHNATTNRAQIETWWKKFPDAGIATPDFDVVDVDLYKPQSKQTWEQIRGLIPKDTPQTRTARGGLQFFFAPGTLRREKIGPGIDNRYAGANYVLLPPSSALGGRYEEVVSVMTRRPKPAPVFPTSSSGGEFRQLIDRMDAGETIVDDRNKATWWRAVQVIRTLPANTDLGAVNTLVQEWVNTHCAGDLSEVDVLKQVRGAAKFVADERAKSNGAVRGKGSITATPVSSSKMRSIRWLEKPLWQRAAFQLFGGPKGAGKGTYLAGLAARLSITGQGVLFVTSEDSVEIDLKPRLVAAGADVERVFVINEHVRLPDDVGEIQRVAAEIEQITLIVIDPVANHLVSGANPNSDAEVRDAIAPLNKLADEIDCLVIGVRHPGKDRSRGAVASILGSTAWVDTPRAVVMVAVDDEDEDIRHIQVVAGNRSRNGAARSFRIDEAMVEGLEEPVTIAVELGESTKSVDDLLRSDARGAGASRSDEAKELILDIIETEGEQESDSLDARIVGETGLAAKTIRNLRVELANKGLIKSFPEKDEAGEIKRWIVCRTQAPRS